MKRRSFLNSLMALPFIGALKPKTHKFSAQVLTPIEVPPQSVSAWASEPIPEAVTISSQPVYFKQYSHTLRLSPVKWTTKEEYGGEWLERSMSGEIKTENEIR